MTSSRTSRAADADVDEEKDEEMAKMAKTCEVLVMKCELLELEKRSIEEKLGHVTQVASTASALVQKLDEALESHDAVLAETRAERDELRAALESTDRDVAASPRAANGGGGEDGARSARSSRDPRRSRLASSTSAPAAPRHRLGAGRGRSGRARASRQLESEKRQLESAARTLRAKSRLRPRRRPPNRASRPARQGAPVRQSRDRVPASGAIAADRKA